mmetsp:Transcript_97187/g.187317  ORF Transcript_97187/g.187317 Transcript_97187/m.187317 type:complete len:95 (+) Transcript_97187:222-506(+)
MCTPNFQFAQIPSTKLGTASIDGVSTTAPSTKSSGDEPTACYIHSKDWPSSKVGTHCIVASFTSAAPVTTAHDSTPAMGSSSTTVLGSLITENH